MSEIVGDKLNLIDKLQSSKCKYHMFHNITSISLKGICLKFINGAK